MHTQNEIETLITIYTRKTGFYDILIEELEKIIGILRKSKAIRNSGNKMTEL